MKQEAHMKRKASGPKLNDSPPLAEASLAFIWSPKPKISPPKPVPIGSRAEASQSAPMKRNSSAAPRCVPACRGLIGVSLAPRPSSFIAVPEVLEGHLSSYLKAAYASPFVPKLLTLTLLLLLLPLLLPAQPAPTSLPLFKGKSRARSGMVYYDHQFAEDKRPRTYQYTLCPDSSECITLDLNVVGTGQTSANANPAPQDFIRIHEGEDGTGPLIATAGGQVGSKFLQSKSGCITIIFTRDQLALASTWTAQWQGKPKAACIDPLAQGPCAEVQDICGPEYRENFHWYSPASRPTAMIETPGTCVEKPRHSAWYRFMAEKDGPIAFSIFPDNGMDDFDWLLLKGDAQNPANCPDLKQIEQRLACNFAQGRGPKGSTGMGDWGESTSADASQCPYSTSITAKKGDVFFLLIDDYSRYSQGFRIQFNDVVMACENPKKDLLPVDQKPILKAPAIDPRRTFNQFTRVLRIDLDEKANYSLAHVAVPESLFKVEKSAASQSATATLNPGTGLPALLLHGLKTARLEAVSPSNLAMPIHYGDLLEFARRQAADTTQPSAGWWTPGPDLLSRFDNVVELIVDETMDPSGKTRQHIRYIRLLWTDRDGLSPDFAVALFEFNALRPFLDQVAIPNRHNEANSLTVMDFLEAQMFQHVTVTRSARQLRNPQESRFLGDRQVELDNYHWE